MTALDRSSTSPTFFLVACLAACSRPAPPPEAAAPAATAKPRSSADTPATDFRALPESARFGELVTRIEQLDGHAREAAEQSCLLQALDAGYRLRAELAVAVRPPPAAAPDLDARLTEAPQLQAFTRHGRVGESEGDLVLVALTATRPAPQIAALIQTDRGSYLLEPGGHPPVRGPMDLQDLAAPLAALANGDPGPALLVTAEADVPLRDVYAALEATRALPLPVALATALPPGTRLPDAPEPTLARCPDGLPPSDEPAGELDLSAVKQGLAPLIEAAKRCADQAGGRAALGGLIQVALRVAAEGRVEHACILEDPLGEPALAACVLAQAPKLRFSSPEPPGVVDLHLPLRLEPAEAPRPAPVCEPSP